jgi:hypothetical protein
MDELIRDLAALAQRLDYPPTPDVAGAVRARLQSAPAMRPVGRRWAWLRLRAPRAIAVSIALLLVLAGSVLAASPAARHAILDLFDLRGARIETTTTPAPEPSRRKLNLGERMSLVQAAGRLGFQPLIPAAVGRPDAVHLDPRIPGGEISLLYRPEPGLPQTETTGLGLLVSEFRGDLNPEYLTKVVPEAASVKRLRIRSHRGAWLAGAPHFFFYRPPAGGVREAPLAVAQNVLVLERGRLLLRFEGAFSLRKAKQIARSLPEPEP